MVCTWPRFEKEVKSNSEMVYFSLAQRVLVSFQRKEAHYFVKDKKIV